MNYNHSDKVKVMKSKDTFKSSNSIDSSITDFIDIPQDDDIFPRSSSDGDHDIRDMIG